MKRLKTVKASSKTKTPRRANTRKPNSGELTAAAIAFTNWKHKPARYHELVIGFFRDEAKQSREWAKEAPLFGNKADLLGEASAIESACEVLRYVARGVRVKP